MTTDPVSEQIGFRRVAGTVLEIVFLASGVIQAFLGHWSEATYSIAFAAYCRIGAIR